MKTVKYNIEGVKKVSGARQVRNKTILSSGGFDYGTSEDNLRQILW